MDKEDVLVVRSSIYVMAFVLCTETALVIDNITLSTSLMHVGFFGMVAAVVDFIVSVLTKKEDEDEF